MTIDENQNQVHIIKKEPKKKTKWLPFVKKKSSLSTWSPHNAPQHGIRNNIKTKQDLLEAIRNLMTDLQAHWKRLEVHQSETDRQLNIKLLFEALGMAERMRQVLITDQQRLLRHALISPDDVQLGKAFDDLEGTMSEIRELRDRIFNKTDDKQTYFAARLEHLKTVIRHYEWKYREYERDSEGSMKRDLRMDPLMNMLVRLSYELEEFDEEFRVYAASHPVKDADEVLAYLSRTHHRLLTKLSVDDEAELERRLKQFERAIQQRRRLVINSKRQ